MGTNWLSAKIKHYKISRWMRKQKRASAIYDIEKLSRKKWSKCIIALIILSVVVIFIGWLLDWNSCINGKFWNQVEHFQNSEQIRNAAGILSANMGKIYEMLISYNAILAATVILFYSVMDNRKEGIPHRRIMSFKFGSKSIPVLFIVSFLLAPFGVVSTIFEYYYLSFIILIIVLLYQMIIIYAVLKATSYNFCVNCIVKMEELQFNYIINHSKEIANKTVYEQTYFTHYIDVVMLSNELSNDKILLVRKILDIPLIKLDDMKIEDAHLYRFYYDNLEKSFSAFYKPLVSDIYILYDALYEFIDRWRERREYVFGLSTKKRKKEEDLCCLLVMSAFWNAALVNSSAEAEMFSINLLNKIDTGCETAITIYLLSLEFASRRDSKAVRIEHLESINGLGKWQFDWTRDMPTCVRFWNIWIDGTPLQKKSFIYLWEALDTLRGQKDRSLPISFIMHEKVLLEKRK